MVSRKLTKVSLQLLLVLAAALPAMSQSYRVQCPAATAAHPRPRCMHLSGGDGFVTMADAGADPLPTYIFGFSSLCRKANGSACTGGGSNANGTISPGIVSSLTGGGGNADYMLSGIPRRKASVRRCDSWISTISSCIARARCMVVKPKMAIKAISAPKLRASDHSDLMQTTSALETYEFFSFQPRPEQGCLH
jgi:hypothetical protein